MSIPITLFTGFLGSGKTTVILSLLPQLQQSGHRIALLKNEIGNSGVDPLLFKESNSRNKSSALQGVKELVAGCLCCHLIGQLEDALLELKSMYQPTWIVIETSGSALPATLVMALQRLDPYRVDACITVIDCTAFTGYLDQSYTAKMQAKYTDLILLNKWEQVTERDVDLVLDKVDTLNLETPRMKTNKGHVDASVIFGLTKTRKDALLLTEQTISDHEEVDQLEFSFNERISIHDWDALMKSLPKENVWRCKGRFIGGEVCLLNWAFGRGTWTRIDNLEYENNYSCNDQRSEKSHITFLGKDLSLVKQRLLTHFPNVPFEIISEIKS